MAKQCEICGTTDSQITGKKGKYGKDLCVKHYGQMKYNGEILERTKLDRNEITVNGDILEVSIYNRKNIEIARALVSAKHYEKIKDIKWHLNSDYVSGKVYGRQTQLHRYIMDAKDEDIVDHCDHNILNNTDNNLRFCTKQQNGFNSQISSNNTSGHVGVSWFKRTGSWASRIKVNGKQIHLGYFKELQNAIAARKAAEVKYFGNFAYNPEVYYGT